MLNISIRFKILGAFMVSALLPLLLAHLQVDMLTILGVSLLAAALLAWYSGQRILSTSARLMNMVSKLREAEARLAKVPVQASSVSPPMPTTTKPAKAKPEDELLRLEEDFEQNFSCFVKVLEDRLTQQPSPASAAPAEPSGAAVPPPAPAASPAQVQPELGLRRQYAAGLASGEAVIGTAIAMPRRVEEDLLLTTRLTGANASHLYQEARELVRHELESMRAAQEITEEQRGILDFQILLLDDPTLDKSVASALQENLTLLEGVNTSFAMMVDRLKRSRNVYIAARAADCQDLQNRLKDAIYRTTNPGVDDLYASAQGKIVLAQQIYPSEVISLYRAGALGVVAAEGTASSHAEILLQSFNLPSLVAIDGLPVHHLAGRRVLLDTHHRLLVIDPTLGDETRIKRATVYDGQAIIRPPVTLASGEPVLVLATINNVTVETKRAVDLGADGVGLFRSEMSYIGRTVLPNEEELLKEYRQLTTSFAGRPISLRMLDLGSDKLAMFQQDEAREENPCMGNRSMRLLLRRPELFRTQIRAMLQAATPETTILFPMISGWHELRLVLLQAEQEATELRREGLLNELPSYGIMVEVPGVAERFADYAPHFEVFNIGSNDLTQYTLAADRNNRAVAEYYNFLHPSMLSMIARICQLGAAHRKRVVLCGEMASNLRILPLVVGLGVRQWSVSCGQLPKIKAALRALHLSACQDLARQALACRATDEVEALMNRYTAAQAPPS